MWLRGGGTPAEQTVKRRQSGEAMSQNQHVGEMKSILTEHWQHNLASFNYNVDFCLNSIKHYR